MLIPFAQGHCWHRKPVDGNSSRYKQHHPDDPATMRPSVLSSMKWREVIVVVGRLPLLNTSRHFLCAQSHTLLVMLTRRHKGIVCMQADLEGGTHCMKRLLDPVTSCHPMSSVIVMTRKTRQGVGYVRLWQWQSQSTLWGHRMAACSQRHCRMGEVTVHWD